jgi:[ribosomal protein S18]-alanine N-acetyltransferase
MRRLIVATPAHAEAMALLHAAAFPAGERWNGAAFAALLGSPGVCGLLDERGGLALVRCAADEAELLTLAVHLSARRRGLGRALLAASLDEASRRRAAAMFLEVAESNAPARALYAAAGFTPVGRRPGYYASGGDALLLKRCLDQAREDARDNGELERADRIRSAEKRSSSV